jgi:hypothetical protein
MTETTIKKINKPTKEKKEETPRKSAMATIEQLLELQKHFNENFCNSRK